MLTELICDNPLKFFVTNDNEADVVPLTPDYRGWNVGYPMPPAQIRMWSLNHPAPTSGFDGKSRVRPQVQDPQRWPESCRQYADLVPRKAAKIRQARAEGPSDRQRGTKLPLNRP